jgi:hypothetical protein
MSAADPVDATVAVRRAVRAALVAEAGGLVSAPGLGGVIPEDFLAAVRRHRVTALLAGQGAAIGLPPDVTRLLTTAREQARLRSLRQLRRLAEVARVLDASGVPTLFVKGPCLAVQTTGDFTARDSGDVDLLVPPTEAAAALTALRAAGWEPVPGLPSDVRSWGWRYLQRVYCEVALTGPLGALDLHWRLDPTRRGLPGFAELWERRAVVEIAGHEFPTLAPADALLHSCHHAAKDDWRTLRSLVDIHRMLRDQPVDTAMNRGLASRTLAVVADTVGLPAGARAPRRVRRTDLERALVAQSGPLIPETGAGRGTYRAARYRLASGRGAEDLAATVAAAVLPPAAFEGVPARSATLAVARGAWRRLRYLARVGRGASPSDAYL